jgi:hypothetical protein
MRVRILLFVLSGIPAVAGYQPKIGTPDEGKAPKLERLSDVSEVWVQPI